MPNSPKAEPTSRRGLFMLGAAALVGIALLLLSRSHPAPPPVHITFEPDDLTRFNTLATDRARIQSNTLQIVGLMNRPLWLTTAIPRDVRVSVKARSLSPQGDLKVELFGDGHSGYQGDPRLAYTATGYILVMGGWNNTISAIAKQHEHGHDRAERSDVHVEPNRWYSWVIERKGNRIDWKVDGQPFLSFDDPSPLYDDDHKYFAFGDWMTPVEFMDLQIEAI